MPPWALRLAAGLSTLLVFVSALFYTTGHVKNPAAPLRPPVPPAATPAPSPSAAPRPTPTPRLSLAPGVRAATLPPITFTHVS